MNYYFTCMLLMVQIFSILPASCKMTTTTTPETDSYSMETESTRKFSSEFYNVVSKNVRNNVILSPLSVHVILSYLSDGAVGNTAAEMINGLSIKDIKRIHMGYKCLLATLKITESELYLSNAIFLHTNVQLLSTFRSLGEEIYHCTIQNMNFYDSVESAKTINDWVAHETNNKILNIIHYDDITDNTRAILINALYFKGRWRYPFNNQYNVNGAFHLSHDIVKQIPIMKNKQRYLHGTLPDLKAKFIEIPYANDSISMVIIMPNDTYALDLLEGNFDWNEIARSTSSREEIELHLPKFKIECTVNLVETLRKMGFHSMFENFADFSEGFIDDSIRIDKIIQKAFIEVNEEGSEASAATVLQIRKKRAISSIEKFIIDRPFMVIIRHEPSNVSLFVGSVRDIGVHVQKDEF